MRNKDVVWSFCVVDAHLQLFVWGLCERMHASQPILPLCDARSNVWPVLALVGVYRFVSAEKFHVCLFCKDVPFSSVRVVGVFVRGSSLSHARCVDVYVWGELFPNGLFSLSSHSIR
jgi:hypothetical protein